MKHFLLTFCALSLSAGLFAQIPSGYYDNAIGKTGDALKDSLNNIIDGHTEYVYTDPDPGDTDVWEILKAADYDSDTTDNVILFYTGWSVDGDQEYNSGDGWTREHIWAKQHGNFGTTKGAGTDCHALRPVDVSVNSAKNNRWFDEAPDAYKDESGFIGSADSSTGCYWDDTLWIWEPRPEVKGDVARAMFYMAVRYEGENGEPDLELVDTLPSNNNTTDPIHAKLSTLLQWHLDDPVDDYERRRHDTVYNYQGNRNPFIDHPEWVCKIWGGPCSAGTVETFDNFTESTSYNTSSFTGEDNVEWSYIKCKGTPTIEGNSAVLGKGYTPAANMKSETIPGGCGTLSFDYMQAYSSTVDCEVYVNDELVGTLSSTTQSQVESASYTVNVTGDFTIEFVQKTTSAGQITIDNINWTPYATTTIETFDNFSEGSSYNSSSFYGTDSVQWTYTSAKGNVSLDGSAATLGKGYTPAGSLVSDSISGGCSEISVEYKRPYSTDVNFNIYINGTLAGNVNGATQNVDTISETFSVTEGGNFVIKIEQNSTTSGQVTIDNITWTSGAVPETTTENETETFDNCTVGGTYSDGSFTGENGNTWNWVESRNEYSYGINGNGLMLRYITDSSSIYSNDIPNGIDSLEFDLKKAYTSSGNRQVEVFVNGSSEGTTTGFDDTNTHHFVFTNIATTGDFDLKILNVTDYQVVVDNIRWTRYQSSSMIMPTVDHSPVLREVTEKHPNLSFEAKIYHSSTKGNFTLVVQKDLRQTDESVNGWVLDATGNKVMELKNVRNSRHINLSDKAKGMYLVKLYDNSGATILKLMNF